MREEGMSADDFQKTLMSFIIKIHNSQRVKKPLV